MSPPSREAASEPPSAETRALLERRFVKAIAEWVPHNKALGLSFVQLEGTAVSVRLPYDARFVGNPATGVLHGGAITTLMDATSGIAVFVKLLQPIPVATLDLRIDYLRPAEPPLDVIARAECVKVTHNVAFVRCEAFHEGKSDDPIALANGTFMIFRDRVFKSKRGGE